MKYLRFLTDRDYCSIATEEHMRQIIRDVPERIPQAEQRAEMQMLEYLDQYYEIEKLLAVGKNIRDYNPNVSYPGGVYVRRDGEIFKTMTSINGIKRPSATVWWSQMTEFIDPLVIDKARKYSQLRMYAKGDVVRFGTEYWRCETPHGFDADEIHMPGVRAWVEVGVTEWEPNMEWEKDQVVSYNGLFYQYLKETEKKDPEEPNSDETQPGEPETYADGEEGGGEHVTPTDPEEPSEPVDPVPPEAVLTPEEDELWGLIGEYSEELEYSYGEEVEGFRDYVVVEDKVYYAMLNPNADALQDGINITRDDPRNANVVAHMARIALYHLHSIISPSNISETRRMAYEDSITWLYNASKFKINPQLPRKKESGTCMNKVDWACETFQRAFDPNENLWLI